LLVKTTVHVKFEQVTLTAKIQ